MSQWNQNNCSFRCRQRFVTIAVFGWLWIAPGILLGQEMARVRNGLDSKPVAWVGQKVSFHIELLSATFFSGTARFDLPEIPGVIVMKVKGSPVVGSTTIDDESWSSQRHSFMVYAYRAGKIEIPSFPVRFSVSGEIGKPPIVQNLKTEPLGFESKMPPGAEGLSLLVSTPDLKVDQNWSKSEEDNGRIELFVGDAISRTVTIVAKDIPAMALPKINFSAIEGLAEYDQTPLLDDKEYRGDLSGQRVDSVTYICERPGEYVIPDLLVSWWDIENQKLEQETLTGFTLAVKEDPDQSIEPVSDVASQESGETSWFDWFWWGLGLLVVGTVVFWGWQFLDHRFGIQTAKSSSRTEKTLFRELEVALVQNNAVTAFNALMDWIEIQSSDGQATTIDRFFKNAAEGEVLQQELVGLQKAVVDKETNWKGSSLRDALRDFRRRRDSQVETRERQALPPLNPPHGSYTR